MGYKAKNDAYSTLASGISAAATSIAVGVGHGDRFPIIAGVDYTLLTLRDAAGNKEIIKVTARASGADTMTVERGQEGTTARAWSAGTTTVDLRPTAALFEAAMDHPSDPTAAHAASAVSFTPAAGIGATDVQAAIEEVVADLAPALATKAPVDSPTFTGDPKAPTPATTDNDTSIATTAFVQAAITAALQAAGLHQMTGMTAYFTGTAAPAGWIVANGAAVSRTTYAALWAYAQASGNLAASEGAKQAGQFGPGNGTTTFSLPDLRGEFIRGWDNSRGVDTGRGIGTYQADELKAHTHSNYQFASVGADGSAVPTLSRVYNNGAGVTGSTGGTETRPRNIALLGCIKL